MSTQPVKRTHSKSTRSRTSVATLDMDQVKSSRPPKNSAGDLAVLGAKPLFVDTQMVGRPNLPCLDDFTDLVREVFESRWLSNRGPMVQRFEEQVAQLSGVKHCVAVANATLGLQLIARALDLVEEVIVPTFTFIATAHAFRWQNASPVLSDVVLDTHQIDPDCVESLINARTQAIVGVHLWGEACDVSRLESIASRHSLPLIFDSAHAFGCTHQSRPVGSFGLAEVFSFHATKFINTFEGGAICTNEDSLAQKLRMMVNFGFGAAEGASCLGMNAKMSEVSAAMGIANLQLMDQLVAHNRQIFEAYRSVLGRDERIRLYPFNLSERRNLQYVVLEVVNDDDSLTRDELVWALAAENIVARRYFAPGIHRQEPYMEELRGRRHFPVADNLSRRVVLVPTGTAVNTDEAAAIGNVIRLILDNADLVQKRFHAIDAEFASIPGKQS